MSDMTKVDSIEDVIYEMNGIVSVIDNMLEIPEDDHHMYLYQHLRNSVQNCCYRLNVSTQ